LIFRLYLYAEGHKTGTFFAGGTGFVIERKPDTVIAPDLAWVRSGQLSTCARDGYVTVPPELAVEVVDCDEMAGDLVPRARMWFTAGTRLVWVVDPAKKTVTIHAPSRQPRKLQLADTLDGEEVLPGLQLPIAEIFR
jgi:Uma2 family endonuclease